jgi:protein SERAC1
VTKKALWLSEQALSPCEQQLSRFTIAVAVLGTPHRGGNFATFATGVANILKAAGKRVNRDILALLQRNSESLAEVEDSFAIWLRRNNSRFDLTCFFEERELPGIGMVVAKDSAKIAGYPFYPIPANHMDMARFTTRDDAGYRRVLGELIRWTKEATSTRPDHG